MRALYTRSMHLPQLARLCQKQALALCRPHVLLRLGGTTPAGARTLLQLSASPAASQRGSSRVGAGAQATPARIHTTAVVRTTTTTTTTTTIVSASSGADETPPDALPPYVRPTTGLLSVLPASWVPYAELTRIDKPTGTYYLYFPCLFATLMAAPMVQPAMATPGAVAGTSLLFFAGALIMRSAGCSINDLWDRNLDPMVARTRHRPLARQAITPFRGLAFTGAQLLAGLGILVQFPTSCLFYGIPSLALVATYPLMKRVTYYPQFVLGLTFSWGAIMGFPALGIDLLANNNSALLAAGLLYSSNVAWTVLYDMIYAHMDIKDDVKAGIKSIALKHDAQTKSVLTGLAAVQVGLLAAAGVASGAGPAFFVGSCGGALVSLGIMIRRVNLKSVKDCWWWFVNGCWLTGGVISLGLGADYLIQYYGREDRTNKTDKTAVDAY